MVLAAFALLLALSGSQDAPDLSADPRLKLTVDVHLKRVLLPDLLHYLKLATGQKFILDADLDQRMVCVFAEHQPLWLIMMDVADVFGGQWKDLRSEWRLNLTRDTRSGIKAYRAAESQQLAGDMAERAAALAAVASKNSWFDLLQGNGNRGPLPADDEKPDKWAMRMARESAYYVAGQMFSRTSILNQTDGKFDCPQVFTDNKRPVAYRLIQPPNGKVAASGQCSVAGEMAAGLEGSQVIVMTVPWAGTIHAVGVDGGSHKCDKPEHMVRYPRPVDALAESFAGQWLLGWESSLKDSHDPVLDNRLVELPLADSPYVGNAHGIEDYLEALSNELKIPVVCDAFRVPIWGRWAVHGTLVREWLGSLKATQKCFVRVQDGSILIRHGGFWDLQLWEPPEEALSRLESLRSPGLDDYADFAFAECMGTAPGSDTDDLPFFETKEALLTRFDPKPLQDSYRTLTAFGELSEDDRERILAGKVSDTYQVFVNRVPNDTGPMYRPSQRRSGKTPTQGDTFSTTVQCKGIFINKSAIEGTFYGGFPVGFEARMLEAGIDAANYRLLWGDSPDPEFTRTFGPLDGNHAHFLSLYNGSGASSASARRADRCVVGTFQFFSSLSDKDGVVNEVVIPDRSGGKL